MTEIRLALALFFGVSATIAFAFDAWITYRWLRTSRQHLAEMQKVTLKLMQYPPPATGQKADPKPAGEAGA